MLVVPSSSLLAFSALFRLEVLPQVLDLLLEGLALERHASWRARSCSRLVPRKLSLARGEPGGLWRAHVWVGPSTALGVRLGCRVLAIRSLVGHHWRSS